MLVYYNLLLDGTWVSTKEISFHQVHVKNEEEEYKMITCFEKQVCNVCSLIQSLPKPSVA